MNKERAKKIISLLIDTDTKYEDIATQCECSRGTINYWVKRINASELKVMPRKKGKQALSIKDLI